MGWVVCTGVTARRAIALATYLLSAVIDHGMQATLGLVGDEARGVGALFDTDDDDMIQFRVHRRLGDYMSAHQCVCTCAIVCVAVTNHGGWWTPRRPMCVS